MPTETRTQQQQPKKLRPTDERFARYFAEDGTVKRPLSQTINRPLTEVAAKLRDVKNFPLFFENLEKVEDGGADSSKWFFRTDKEDIKGLIMEMRLERGQSDEGLTWTAKDGAGFSYAVAIQLEQAQAGRGTVARMMVAYESTAGDIAAYLEKLFGTDALVTSKKNLQRFKAFCETGHVPTIEGQSSGREENTSQTLKH